MCQSKFREVGCVVHVKASARGGGGEGGGRGANFSLQMAEVDIVPAPPWCLGRCSGKDLVLAAWCACDECVLSDGCELWTI